MMVSLKNVSKIYKRNVVLNRFNLNIESNKFYLLTGQNGSGKSTCLKLISKQINYNNKSDSYINNSFKDIVYMPEKFTLPKLMNVLDFLSLFLSVSKKNKKLNSYLLKYNISNMKISKLSKGTMQKVLIIGTVLSNADLYLFDEPLDGLDDNSKILFTEDLIDLKRNNKTIVISTHFKEIYNKLDPMIIDFGGED